jgi:hypothetical protein
LSPPPIGDKALKSYIFEVNLSMAESNPEGRPTKYKEEFNVQAYKLCLLGHTDKELAEFFEVSEDTIYEWKKVHPEFSEAVTRGKTIADAEVAHSFHKRAIGYKYDEVTFEKIGEKEEVEDPDDLIKSVELYKKKIVTKEVAPDPGAALNWLKNRQPAKWRDKQEIEHSGNIDSSVHIYLPDNDRGTTATS